MTRIEWEPGWEQQLDEEIGDMMTRLGRDMFADVRRDTPRDTGRLHNALFLDVDGKEFRIGWRGVEYGIYVEYGTPPHVIRPRAKKALHWPGALHPVARVNHPGTPAFAMLRSNLYKTRAVS